MFFFFFLTPVSCRLIGELSSRTPTFEESVSRDSFDKLASLYEQLSRGAPPEDPFGRADVSGASDPDDDDVSEEYESDEDDLAWLSEWAHSDGEESEVEVEESDNESGELFQRSEDGRGLGNGVSFEGKNDDRLATGGLAETSGRPNSASGDGAASEGTEKSANGTDNFANGTDNVNGTEKSASGKFRSTSEAEAIPVAFGKGRVNLGAAVKRRRRTGGEGYSSGSDSDGPPRRGGTGLRLPERDLEIFQRFDTLPDFGCSTGDEDHRGRMHRRWRDVEREVENGTNGTNGRNGKVTGVGAKSKEALQRKGSNGTGAGNGRLEGISGPTVDRAMVGSKKGVWKGLATEGGQNGRATRAREGEPVGDGGSSKADGHMSSETETRFGEGERKALKAEERSSGGSEGADFDNGEESESDDGRSSAGEEPLVIRSTTKRVPGQSPRVAKPRVTPPVSSNDDGKAERMSQQGNGRLESYSASGERRDGWDLIADPETMRSPLLGSNGAGNGKKRVGKGKPGRAQPPPQRSAPRGRVELEDNLYRDLESTPFDELTTEQMMALKYGHTSGPSTEQVKRARRRR